MKIIRFTCLNIANIISIILSSRMRRVLQYVSDLHVDSYPMGKHPLFLNKVSDTLLICGDIGSPKHPNYALFCKYLSNEFNKIFVVPGNHEYDLSSCYCPTKVKESKQILKDILADHKIGLLDNSHYEIDKDVFIYGATLWSNPDENSVDYMNRRFDNERFQEHKKQHKIEVEMIEKFIQENYSKKIILGTHMCPTPRLIEQKYYTKQGKPSQWFSTDLESKFMLENGPVIACIAGHTHSNYETTINGVFCAVNADHKDGIMNTKCIMY